MTKPELVVALPISNALSKEYKDWLQRRVLELAKKLPAYDVVLFIGEAESLSHNRNTSVALFLNRPNAVWLWQTAPDMEWEADDVVKLIEANKLVIGGFYSSCEEWPKWAVTFYEDVKPDETGVLAVPEIGANSLLIHRSAFEIILQNKTIPLDYRTDGQWETNYAFFQQCRVAFNGVSRLLKEEYFFEWLCREAKIGVFAHTRVKIKRHGGDGHLYPKIGQEPPILPTPPEDASKWPVVKQEGAFVICIQYWEGDHDQAVSLWDYISHQPLPSCDHAIRLVESTPGLKYPTGPNKLAFDLMNEAANGATWAANAKCILLIEPDCVPVASDWIDQLSEEWDRAAGQGKLIMGAWTGDDMAHLNGNLIFSPKLASVIDLGPTPPRRPWDVAFAPAFQPHWCKTGLIKSIYRSTNVTAAQIETPECGTKPPVLIHGCRDGSAWNYAKRKLT